MALRRRRRKSGAMELQVTALIDVMVVILIFLLKSYSSSSETVDGAMVPKGLQVPDVLASTGTKPGVRVEVSETGVQVDGRAIASLTQYQFAAADLSPEFPKTSVSRILGPALRESRENFIRENSNSKNGAENVVIEPRLWLVADRRAPYATVQTVIATASQAGFANISLIVMKKE